MELLGLIGCFFAGLSGFLIVLGCYSNENPRPMRNAMGVTIAVTLATGCLAFWADRMATTLIFCMSFHLATPVLLLGVDFEMEKKIGRINTLAVWVGMIMSAIIIAAFIFEPIQEGTVCEKEFVPAHTEKGVHPVATGKTVIPIVHNKEVDDQYFLHIENNGNKSRHAVSKAVFDKYSVSDHINLEEEK